MSPKGDLHSFLRNIYFIFKVAIDRQVYFSKIMKNHLQYLHFKVDSPLAEETYWLKYDNERLAPMVLDAVRHTLHLQCGGLHSKEAA